MSSEVGRRHWVFLGEGRELSPGLVRAMTVAVLGIGVQDLSSMGLVPDQQVVEDLAP